MEETKEGGHSFPTRWHHLLTDSFFCPYLFSCPFANASIHSLVTVDQLGCTACCGQYFHDIISCISRINKFNFITRLCFVPPEHPITNMFISDELDACAPSEKHVVEA